jgi:GntR family transcriptional repressor for pyruvate dehydrogenase complex
LPSERELVKQLQVSRTSIREALRALETVGLIESRQGEGNFIKEKIDDSFLEPLSIMFLLQGSTPEEILELRRIIEVEAVRLAAGRISEQELEEIEFLLNNFGDEDEEKNVRIDKSFHYAIGMAAKNQLLLNILNSISGLMDYYIKYMRQKVIADRKNIDLLMKQHEKIYLALKEHNPQKAAEAMLEHLEFTNSCMLEYNKNLVK